MHEQAQRLMQTVAVFKVGHGTDSPQPVPHRAAAQLTHTQA